MGLYERVVEQRGFKYIKLKSGRLIGYWEARTLADAGYTDMSRSVSRALKLTDDDYELERLEWFIEDVQRYCRHVLEEIEKRRGIKTKEERIAKLRNTDGRTPAEAEAFRRKADELEAAL